jgi:carboxyl-terminal processing protease
MKSWVLDSMQDYYLFYDQLPSIDEAAYPDPESYVEALRVTPFDRYSYVTEEASSQAFFEEGQRFGFGMRVQRTTDGTLYFTLVEPLSPLGAANVERGDEIVAINGVSADSFTAEFIEAAFGGLEEAIDITFTVRKRGQTDTVDVTVTKGLYDIQTVLANTTLQHNNKRVGYLNFLTFLDTSESELNTAFTTLKNEQVDELVLDLRYNLGGRIAIAEQLGSLIAGQAVDNTTFTRFTYNDKYSHQDVSYPFQARTNALDLERVYVLTSPDTCSASEMVINSLRPFIEVITVGGTTCGKPFGTRSNAYCGKVINALEVNLLNAANAGGYYDGMPASCPASENITQRLGEPGENLLSAALYHIDNQQCELDLAASQSVRQADNRKTLQLEYREGPQLLNPSYDEIRPLLLP